jgi:CubicO group peptidase (beta-lactamase class C family)
MNRRAFVASLSAILALLVALVIISSVAPPLAAQPPLPDTVEGFERVFVGWAQKQGITGGTLAVARDVRLVLIKGYGDRRGDDRVLLASLSKAITAVCVATLVQQGRLSFATSLGDSLPRSLGTPVDPGLRKVTIEQLLTHRAGFGDGHGGDPATGELGGELAFHRLLRRRGPVLAEARDLWANVIRFRLQNPPGEVYRYTNAAYLALGLIIEAVSARPYEEYCASAVLAPAGIANARLDPTWRILGAFGGWRLSGPEYLAFLRVFRPDGPVLDAERRRWTVMTAGREMDVSGQASYTLGVVVRTVSEGHNLSHRGAFDYHHPYAMGGPLHVSIGSLAVRPAIGTSWFAFYEPLLTPEARGELDRELWRAARGVRIWPAEVVKQ